MITRPDGLVTEDVIIELNFLTFNKLEIDLVHVNKDKRSTFSSIEVVALTLNLINKKVLAPSDEKYFGDEICSYFVKNGIVNDKKYKLVFCICSDRPETIGVITLHRM